MNSRRGFIPEARYLALLGGARLAVGPAEAFDLVVFGRVLGRAPTSGFETSESGSSLHAVEVTPRTFGCQSMTGRLGRVLVKPPTPGAWTAWRAYGWRAEPDAAALEAECEALNADGFAVEWRPEPGAYRPITSWPATRSEQRTWFQAVFEDDDV